MDVYEILSEIMEYEGLSIANVAKKCGLPDSTVRGIVTRKQKTISLEVAFKISNGLGVSLEKLNGMEENRGKEKNIIKNNVTEKEFQTIIQPYRKLDKFGKETVKIVLDRETERIEQLKEKEKHIEELEKKDYLKTFAAHDKNSATKEEKEADIASMDDKNIWKK